MLTGITDIELLPPATGGMDLVKQIRNLFSGANAIRASIAFWTLSPEKLNDITNYQAKRVLKAEQSFICVDLQRPTSIDHLATRKLGDVLNILSCFFFLFMLFGYHA